ncbi:NifU family protein [Urechidicola vernalis]|uniref:NifU family protein n=1 Tax=Urechidicola vernalis TaxID=3075600 RepID=A0ABU2Y4X7_9FLAO|nr:NifU family protein [Urechidicola sp. P050]MDT0553251.1 NifU family protein [Urechidicola sp. P050]
MQSISVSIQATSNSSIIKFAHTGQITNGSYEYNNIDDAKNSTLAQELFHLPFVKKVFISANFVAIEKFDIVSWNDVQEEVREQLEKYLNDGKSLINSTSKSPSKTGIEIYAETTPNPSVMKFVANKMIVSQTFEFKNIDEAKDSPISVELFKFPFVKEVFISENYISITKYEMAEWSEIGQEIRGFLREYITKGKIIISEKAAPIAEKISKSNAGNYDEISLQIISILDEYVKPAVASDGGNIQFASYEEDSKTVNVILQGACSGCPSSTITLKNGIETMLKQMIPNKIENVIAING